jgi:hypothetical protein
MRTKLSDWKVGEKVIFVNCHNNEPHDMVVVSIGRKYLGIGREGSKESHYKFEYTDNGLRFVGGYCHSVHPVDEYKLMSEYNKALRNAVCEMNTGMSGDGKWTEENIQRLGKILELINDIKA